MPTKPPKGIYKLNEPNRKCCWVWERRSGGERKRTFFRTLNEAIAWKARAEREVFRGADSRDIFGSDKQKEYDAAKKIVGANVSLVEAALFYRDNLRKATKEPTRVEDAVAKILSTIESRNLSREFVGASKTYYTRFAEAFKGRMIHSITSKEIIAWIQSMGLSARSMLAISNKMVYLFRRAKSLGFTTEVPEFDKTLLPRPDPAPVEVYTTEQTERILRFVARNRPVMLPNLVIRAFCGLRTKETSLLRWEWIDEANRRLLVPSTICKTRDDWVLQCPTLPDTVFRWLAVIPQEEKHGVIPSPDTGFGAYLRRNLPGLPMRHNGFRHTFCTMHISLHGNAEQTATLLKHRGTATLFAHYLGKLVPQEEARAYFALSPQ